MRASLVISSHNEGDRLWKTVQSCVETTSKFECEIVVADDASSDGSLEELTRRFPDVRVFANSRRRGVSRTKDLGAREARGEVLVFLDGHCKPEPWAIERLVNNVEDGSGQAIVTPRVPALDCQNWQNNLSQIGNGYRITLEKFECGWIGLKQLRPHDGLYECPALIGCCVAMSRELYRRTWGFDCYMVDWGVEDIDFGLKAWLLGFSILHNPRATIGHRFRRSFDNYTVAEEAIVVNQLRMARKNFTEQVWDEWVSRSREREPEDLWASAWARFSKDRYSVETEREYLLARRQRDEFSYAQRFGLDWPTAPLTPTDSCRTPDP